MLSDDDLQKATERLAVYRNKKGRIKLEEKIKASEHRNVHGLTSRAGLEMRRYLIKLGYRLTRLEKRYGKGEEKTEG